MRGNRERGGEREWEGVKESKREEGRGREGGKVREREGEGVKEGKRERGEPGE